MRNERRFFLGQKMQSWWHDEEGKPTEPHKVWLPLLWASSGFLWSVWLMQNAANIAVYLPRSLNWWEFLLFCSPIVGAAGGTRLRGTFAGAFRITPGTTLCNTMLSRVYMLRFDHDDIVCRGPPRASVKVEQQCMSAHRHPLRVLVIRWAAWAS